MSYEQIFSADFMEYIRFIAYRGDDDNPVAVVVGADARDAVDRLFGERLNWFVMVRR